MVCCFICYHARHHAYDAKVVLANITACHCYFSGHMNIGKYTSLHTHKYFCLTGHIFGEPLHVRPISQRVHFGIVVAWCYMIEA